jgi:2-iminoacetate synthase ThiH
LCCALACLFCASDAANSREDAFMGPATVSSEGIRKNTRSSTMAVKESTSYYGSHNAAGISMNTRECFTHVRHAFARAITR